MLVPNQRNMVFQLVPKLVYNVQQEYNKIAISRNKLLIQANYDQETVK